MKKLNFVLIVAVTLAGVTLAASPSQAQSYPDVRGKSAFTQEANYMSLPGFLRWHYLWMSGRWISRNEARLAVSQQVGTPTAMAPRTRSARTPRYARLRTTSRSRSRSAAARRRAVRLARVKRQSRVAAARVPARTVAAKPQVRVVALARMVPRPRVAPVTRAAPVTRVAPVAPIAPATDEPIFLN